MLMTPWLVGFFAFTLYPLVYSLYLSFHHVSNTAWGIETAFRGFDNYRRVLFTDADFPTNMLTFVQTLIPSVLIIVVFALFIAMLINYPIRGRGFFRAVFFLPVVISSGEVLDELFGGGSEANVFVSQYGIIDAVTGILPPVLSEPVGILLTQLIVTLWYSGVPILIFLSGLQKIDKAVFEAASVDGASGWEAFWKITLPYLKPFIMIGFVYSTVFLCTSSLNPIIGQIKETMYGSITTGYGYATAMAWIYFLAVFVIVAAIVSLMSRRDRLPRERRRRRA
jgi:ABC-type sugar transport system permease subunit